MAPPTQHHQFNTFLDKLPETKLYWKRGIQCEIDAQTPFGVNASLDFLEQLLVFCFCETADLTFVLLIILWLMLQTSKTSFLCLCYTSDQQTDKKAITRSIFCTCRHGTLYFDTNTDGLIDTTLLPWFLQLVCLGKFSTDTLGFRLYY